MNKINTEMAVKHLIKELNLKNEGELAEKLNMTKNAFSMLKKRNSLGTLIEKVLISSIDKKISIDSIVYGHNSNCFLAIELAQKCNKTNEFNNIINNFIEANSFFYDLKNVIEKVKGQNFFEQFFEQFHNKGEKILKLLYYFIDNIEKNEKSFNISNIKNEFINELERFELSSREKILSFEIKDKDKQNLVTWVKDELDEVTIFEIIKNTTELKKIILANLNIFDKIIVKVK